MAVKKFLCRLITTLQDLQPKDILLGTVAGPDQPGRLEEAQYHLEKTHFQIRYKMRSGTVEYIYKSNYLLHILYKLIGQIYSEVIYFSYQNVGSSRILIK